MNAAAFKDIYRELIDENPLAIRAVLKILEVEFTDTVPTLAVTCDGRPRLLVNLGFVRDHCRTDAQVKAVICHEFLHVLLRHTECFTIVTKAEHVALDAVINAIIHRSLGAEYSAMMSRYYAHVTGVARLLRPMTEADASRAQRASWGGVRVSPAERQLLAAWSGLYSGHLVADDIRDLARDQCAAIRRNVPLLGGHDHPAAGQAGGTSGDEVVPGAGGSEAGADGEAILTEAVETALKAMNGSGIFRSPKGRGIGATAYHSDVRAADTDIARWRRETYAVLRRHLLPDAQSIAREAVDAHFTLPVLSPGDRRAVLKARWSPLIPTATWDTAQPARAGSAHVYLDVSGSMSAEMPLIVALLGRLRPYIRRPFWAFSNVVAPARIERGRLLTETTGGTSLSCVLAHVARTTPRAAIIVTDGYIEALEPRDVAAATKHTRLHVIVTRDGNAG
ncbi:MAG: M48 family metalloprotease, partial [Acidobacteria bacterium]|nr:M48 family metalloprotease [Acidobacteriota bacterium]